MENKVLEMFTNTIYEKDNKPVLMDTITCITHRFNGTSTNCNGCEGELQCSKLTALRMLDVLSRTGQIAMLGVTSGFAVMEYMVDIVRAKDLDALKNTLPNVLRFHIYGNTA